jgi:hypothetical protein
VTSGCAKTRSTSSAVNTALGSFCGCFGSVIDDAGQVLEEHPHVDQVLALTAPGEWIAVRLAIVEQVLLEGLWDRLGDLGRVLEPASVGPDEKRSDIHLPRLDGVLTVVVYREPVWPKKSVDP